jgi:hypothetical protein
MCCVVMCYIYHIFSKLAVITVQMDDFKNKTKKNFRISQIELLVRITREIENPVYVSENLGLL